MRRTTSIVELGDECIEEIEEKGYVIVPGFQSGETLKELQAAQRRILSPWEEIKDDPPSGRSTLSDFPPAEIALLRGTADHRACDCGRKWLSTENIHYRAGCMIARYPGFKSGGVGSDASALHVLSNKHI